MVYRQNLLQGALLILASEFMFASMGACVKVASAGMPSEMIVFMRNLFGLVVIMPLVLRNGGFRNLGTRVFPLHLLRALMGVSAMYCFFYVIRHLHLADAMLLKMTAPIFMPLVAFFWLQELAPKLAIAALPIGFVGVLLVLNPEGEFTWLALFGLLGGLLAAVAKVSVRRLGRTEPATRVVFYFALLATLISAHPLAWAWQTPSGSQWALALLIGVLGTLGQLLLTRGYGTASVSQVGPFGYFSVVFAATYGYLYWDEVLDVSFIAGALLIAFAGILVLSRRADAVTVWRTHVAVSSKRSRANRAIKRSTLASICLRS